MIGPNSWTGLIVLISRNLKIGNIYGDGAGRKVIIGELNDILNEQRCRVMVGFNF